MVLLPFSTALLYPAFKSVTYFSIPHSNPKDMDTRLNIHFITSQNLKEKKLYNKINRLRKTRKANCRPLATGQSM
jgi:hypothetical protein